VEAKIIKATQRTLDPRGPQESTKMEKLEATIKVPTDVLEDPVAKVVEVAVAKAVTDPTAKTVVDEETATAVVDFVPKVIAPLLSEMV